MRRPYALVLLALAAASTSGCSWLFVTPPPEGHERMRYFDCTTSRVAPAFDVVGAGLYGLTGAVVAASGEERIGLPREAGFLYLGVAVVDVASAAYGFSATSRCEKAKSAMMERDDLRETHTWSGCRSDVDCKGDRVCELGACVSPIRSPTAPPPTPLPAPQGAPPPPPMPPDETMPAVPAPTAPTTPTTPTPPAPAPAPAAPAPATPPPVLVL